MKNLFFEKRCRYSIRKLSIGACSLMIGSALFASPALAEQVAVPETAANTSAQATSASETANPDTAAIEKQLSETENKVAEQPISENTPAITDLVNEKEEAKPALTDKTEKPIQPTEKEEVKGFEETNFSNNLFDIAVGKLTINPEVKYRVVNKETVKGVYNDGRYYNSNREQYTREYNELRAGLNLGLEVK